MQKFPKSEPILVFGAHPDDIEFGAGAIIALETHLGRKAHFVVTSSGEAASSGTSSERESEARDAAKILGATIEFIELDGDGHLEIRASHAVKLAQIIRNIRPATVLATSVVANQHPDHAKLGQIVRDAARLARYGGLTELQETKSHSIEQLLFYAVTPDGEPQDMQPVLIDISQPEIITTWTSAMQAHKTQAATRNYVDLQLNRARLLGARVGLEYAMAVYSNESLLFDSLSQLGRGARNF